MLSIDDEDVEAEGEPAPPAPGSFVSTAGPSLASHVQITDYILLLHQYGVSTPTQAWQTAGKVAEIVAELRQGEMINHRWIDVLTSVRHPSFSFSPLQTPIPSIPSFPCFPHTRDTSSHGEKLD